MCESFLLVDRAKYCLEQFLMLDQVVASNAKFNFSLILNGLPDPQSTKLLKEFFKSRLTVQGFLQDVVKCLQRPTPPGSSCQRPEAPLAAADVTALHPAIKVQSAGATRWAGSDALTSRRGVYIQTNGLNDKNGNLKNEKSATHHGEKKNSERTYNSDSKLDQYNKGKSDKTSHAADDDVKPPSGRRSLRRRLSDTFRKNKNNKVIQEETESKPSRTSENPPASSTLQVPAGSAHKPHVPAEHHIVATKPPDGSYDNSERTFSELSTGTYTVPQRKVREKSTKKKGKSTKFRANTSATEQALLDEIYSRLPQSLTEEELIRTLVQRNAELTDR